MTASSESAEKGYGPFSSGAVSEKGLSPVSEAPLDDKYLIEQFEALEIPRSRWQARMRTRSGESARILTP